MCGDTLSPCETGNNNLAKFLLLPKPHIDLLLIRKSRQQRDDFFLHFECARLSAATPLPTLNDYTPSRIDLFMGVETTGGFVIN